MNWRADLQPNGQSTINTSSHDGIVRRLGYRDRVATVDERQQTDLRVQVIYTANIRRRVAYANDPSDYTYPNAVVPRRVRLNAREEFVREFAHGYTGYERWIWCPPGVRMANVVNGDDYKQMTAIGCTCRDMYGRGVLHARWGCKHIIAYNKAQANMQLFGV